VRSQLPRPAPGEPGWALFLDIDGTLLEIAGHPDGVIVPPELVNLLDRLHGQFSGACALVSGRDLSFIDSKLRWKARDAAGCHGAEVRLDGEIAPSFSDSDIMQHVTNRLLNAAAHVPGAFVEIKGKSIALHYGATAFTDSQAMCLADEAAGVMGDSLRIVSARNAVEILPKDAGKGRAIANLLKHPRYWGRTPVFAGDDIVDEEGFCEVNDRGGISICIGDRKTTAAKYRVRSVSEFREWLAELAKGSICSVVEI